MPLNRREAVASIAATLAAGACATGPDAGAGLPPIVFVHGNGDTASIWLTTLWRFESNGWPRERLHAVDLPNPTARDDNGVPQPGRSSIDEYAQFLAKEVDAVLARTGARQVALVGNSRGGLAIRHYVKHFGGAPKVSHAVMGGTPNHGIWADPAVRPNHEFNGASAFMRTLNAPQGPKGEEVTPGPRWLTLRSDRNDKYAQPEGTWIGARGMPTHVTYEGPALQGATNVVLPGADHREVSFGPLAFAETYRFITGRAPATVEIAPEPRVVLNGKVSGQGPGGPTNLPLVGADFAVYAVDTQTGERRGEALVRKTIGEDGLWGPLVLEAPTPALEFVVAAPGHATTHVYRAPLPRSSGIVNVRADRLNEADKSAGAVVVFTRPRGYFGVGRDDMRFDSQSPPPGVAPGVAGVASSRLRLPPAAAPRTVVGEFNGERIAARTWPASENALVVLELQR